MEKRYNRFKKELSAAMLPKLASESYAKPDGSPNWQGDPNGFDRRYSVEPYILPKGTRILRYGDEEGYNAAPLHTPYSHLAMPYLIESCEYNEYEVVEDGVYVEKVNVVKGIVAQQPVWPEEPGGGIQYYFPEKDNRKSVHYYVGRGLRRLEVSEWSNLLEEDASHR